MAARKRFADAIEASGETSPDVAVGRTGDGAASWPGDVIGCLAFLCLAACGGPAPAPPPPLYQPDLAPAGAVCPEATDQAAYAFLCDATGLGGCMLGAEPSMCTHADHVRHDCDCDELTRCTAYRDARGNAVVGCVRP
jgi:hypothetical protein